MKDSPIDNSETADSIVCSTNIDHWYGRGALKKQILFNVTFNIKEGEVVIVHGPSGSGKSTLLTLLGGLRQVQSGNLNVLGEELSGAEHHKLVQIRRQIGFIFQLSNLVQFLTSRQNIEMALLLNPNLTKRSVRERCTALLKAVDLTSHGDYYPNALSVGQRQRISVARALANSPRLVLADEPTASLDGQSGRLVVELLRNLARERKSAVIIVTHDSRILDIADRTFKLEDGTLGLAR